MPPIYSQLQLLGEPTRVRLLRLTEAEELTVNELTQITQLPQPTISRHLKQLHTHQWINRRKDGNSTKIRMATELSQPCAELWSLVRDNPESTQQFDEDARRMRSVISERAFDPKAQFGRLAHSWDAIRSDLFGTQFLLPAILSLLPKEWHIADLGCGTGETTAKIASSFERVFAIDREEAMIDAAKARLQAHSNVSIHQADLSALPLEDGAIDAAYCILVLHHIRSLKPVFLEIERVLKPGGRVVIVDMQAHTRRDYRFAMGHAHLGFSQRDLADQTTLKIVRYIPLKPDSGATGPELFLAVLEKS